MWRRRSLGLGGGNSKLEQEIGKKVHLSSEEEEGTSPRPFGLAVCSTRLRQLGTWSQLHAAGMRKWPTSSELKRAYGVVVKRKKNFREV
jgi:hypothetical protein